MKDAWWDQKAKELPRAANQPIIRAFYAGLRHVLELEVIGIATLRNAD